MGLPRAFGQGLDLTVGAAGRSYPLSGVVEAEAGYGILLWGERSSPLYGYLRPKIDASTVGTYNSLGGALEVFPLSFLGGRAGGEAVQNDKDYTAYDCARWRCMGRYYRTFVEAEMSMGLWRLFAQGRWRRERWTQKDADAGDFMDPTSGLVMRSQGDAQTVYQGLAGVKLSERWAVMGGVRYAESDEREFSRFAFGLVRYKEGAFSIGLGGGAFNSTVKVRQSNVMGFLRWEVLPGIGLN